MEWAAVVRLVDRVDRVDLVVDKVVPLAAAADRRVELVDLAVAKAVRREVRLAAKGDPAAVAAADRKADRAAVVEPPVDPGPRAVPAAGAAETAKHLLKSKGRLRKKTPFFYCAHIRARPRVNDGR